MKYGRINASNGSVLCATSCYIKVSETILRKSIYVGDKMSKSCGERRREEKALVVGSDLQILVDCC